MKEPAPSIDTLPDRFKPPQGWSGDLYFDNEDGKKIRYGFVKAKEPSRGTIVMTTGYADFIESYFETMHDMLDRGFDVWIMDWPGQGGSERYDAKNPKLPDPNGFFDNIRDLHKFRTQIVRHDPEKPIFLNSHSMGGHIGFHILHKFPGDFDFAVLAAPLANFEMSIVRRRLYEVFLQVASGVGYADRQIPSRRRRVVERIKEDREQYVGAEPIRMRIHKIWAEAARNDPARQDLRIGDPTLGWSYTSMKAVRLLNEPYCLQSITTPVLVLIAENDRLVHNESTLKTVKQIPGATIAIIKDASHALWTEREKIRKNLLENFDSYVDKQIDRFHNRKKKPQAIPLKKLI